MIGGFKKGKGALCIGNEAKVIALTVSTYYLSLPFRLVLELNNFCCLSTLTANIISVSYLGMEDFCH